MLFSLTMYPIGAGDTIAGPVAEVIDEIDRAGLSYEVTGMDTIIEAEWDELLPVVRQAHDRLREKHARVFTVLMCDDHAGSEGRLESSIHDIEQRLGRPVPH